MRFWRKCGWNWIGSCMQFFWFWEIWRWPQMLNCFAWQQYGCRAWYHSLKGNSCSILRNISRSHEAGAMDPNQRKAGHTNAIFLGGTSRDYKPYPPLSEKILCQTLSFITFSKPDVKGWRVIGLNLDTTHCHQHLDTSPGRRCSCRLWKSPMKPSAWQVVASFDMAHASSHCQATSKVSNKDLFVYIAIAFYSRECEFFWTCSFDLNLIVATSLAEHCL